jgi:hypothetical protein
MVAMTLWSSKTSTQYYFSLHGLMAVECETDVKFSSSLASWEIASVLNLGTVSALAFIAATTMLFANNEQVVSCLLTLVGRAGINSLSLDDILLVTRFL